MNFFCITNPIVHTINNNNSCQSSIDTIDEALSAVFINKVIVPDCKFFPYLKHSLMYIYSTELLTMAV